MSAATQASAKLAERWAADLNKAVAGKLADGSLRGKIHLVFVNDKSPTHPRAAVEFDAPAAERIARAGLKASAIEDLAAILRVETRELIEYIGIDRTTVKRRAQKGESLPTEAAVKAMQFVELVTVAADVFGGVDPATMWLTKPHSLLAHETPLQRARTPWGMKAVLMMLNSLKYGGVA